MSLLTKEQQETLDRAYQYCLQYSVKTYPQDTDMGLIAHRLYCFIGELRTIIDDLQDRAPKQYTEQDLREAFENANNTYRLEKEKFGRRTVYENQHVQTEFEGWVACAKSVGALKAEP